MRLFRHLPGLTHQKQKKESESMILAMDNYKHVRSYLSLLLSHLVTPELVVGSRDGLHRIDLLNTSWVKHRKLKEIVSLDFGSDPSLIYWSDRNTINLLDLHNGDTKEIRFHHGGVKLLVESLAVDGPANKLYWADSVQGVICVGDLRNRRSVELIKKNLDSPRAIVVGKG